MMFDNLTVDDIMRIYSEVMLDEAIGLRPASTSRFHVYARLMVENESKRPFSRIIAG